MVVDLLPHPALPAPRGLRLSVRALRETASLRLIYRLEGAIAEIRWPPAAQPVRADGLWRTTCCEAFLQDRRPAYVELNAAPSGAWAAYAFAHERDENRADAALALEIMTQKTADALILEALVAGADLSWRRPWRAGFAAILEDAAGGLSYWAMNHPKNRPDFHDPQGFAALLPAGDVP